MLPLSASFTVNCLGTFPSNPQGGRPFIVRTSAKSISRPEIHTNRDLAETRDETHLQVDRHRTK